MLLELVGCGSLRVNSVEVDELLRDNIYFYGNSKETGPSSTPSSTSAEFTQHQRNIPLVHFPEGARGDLTTSTTSGEGHDRGTASSGPSLHSGDDDKSAPDTLLAAVTAARPTLTSSVSARPNDYKGNTIPGEGAELVYQQGCMQAPVPYKLDRVGQDGSVGGQDPEALARPPSRGDDTDAQAIECGYIRLHGCPQHGIWAPSESQ